MESSYAETFAEAFLDPNIVIGVFERVDLSWAAMEKSLGEDWAQHVDEFLAITDVYTVIMLRPEKAIAGLSGQPVVFCCPVRASFFMEGFGFRRAPLFLPSRGRKWILALERTTHQQRLVQYGEMIADCSFFNDQTFFNVHNFGYGALCLEPVGEPNPRNTNVVPEEAILDLENIQKVVSFMNKETRDPNETAAVEAAQAGLQTDIAKSIFEAMLSQRRDAHEDPNAVSK